MIGEIHQTFRLHFSTTLLRILPLNYWKLNSDFLRDLKYFSCLRLLLSALLLGYFACHYHLHSFLNQKQHKIFVFFCYLYVFCSSSIQIIIYFPFNSTLLIELMVSQTWLKLRKMRHFLVNVYFGVISITTWKGGEDNF